MFPPHVPQHRVTDWQRQPERNRAREDEHTECDVARDAEREELGRCDLHALRERPADTMGECLAYALNRQYRVWSSPVLRTLLSQQKDGSCRRV